MKPRDSATIRPMVVFPDPAGPSMAMITLETGGGLQAGHFLGPKWADAALGQVTKLKPVDSHALQVEHAMAEGLPEPAHFALAALPQHHAQPGLGGRTVEHRGLGRLETFPAHDHPLREPPQCIRLRPTRDHDPVFL